MLISKSRIAIFLAVFVVVIFSGTIFAKKPSHDRNWENGQDKLPKIEIAGDKVKVDNFRNFDWQDNGEVENIYQQEEFDLDKLQGVDVIISHFDDFEGLAHIFLSFRFADNKNMVVSFETRREVGEEFSPLLGLMRKFEIIYVVGSERDIIGLRTDIRKERVHLYPISATPEKSRELFLLLANDINSIYAEPVFYNTLFNNCTNAITRRAEDISEINFPLTHKAILPGYMDEVLYELELIPTEKSFEENKKHHLIDNNKVNRNDADYSSEIRKR